MLNWLKKLFSKKENEKVIVITKEDELNNKYPKSNFLCYSRTESDGTYLIDLRNFIFEYDYSIPTVTGLTDDDKALAGLKLVKELITYVSDKNEYNLSEYWAYPYQTLKHKKGDCEDGAILLYNILLRSGVPYWKIRLSAGSVKLGNKKAGHAYLTYYCEDSDKWVVLDWCYWYNDLPIKERKDYKDEENYLDVWFSWNQKYCFTKGLNTEAKKILK